MATQHKIKWCDRCQAETKRGLLSRSCLPCQSEKARKHRASRTPEQREADKIRNREAWHRRCARNPNERERPRRGNGGRYISRPSTLAFAKRDRLARLAWMREGDVTAEQLRLLRDASNSRCNYCGVLVQVRCCKTAPRGFDHVIPRTHGGKHTAANLVVCCRDCNTAKRCKPVESFRPTKRASQGAQ